MTTHALPRAAVRPSIRISTALAYWVPTVLVGLSSIAGGIYDALRPEAALAVFHHLGYPDYFATLLGTAKLLGGLAILLPVPRMLREWAYAGLTFDVLSALISLLAVGHAITELPIPIFVLALVQTSYWTWRRRQRDVAG